MLSMDEYRDIRNPEDVTEDHIAEAVDMRDGLYGGQKIPWDDVIDRLEGYNEDWGADLESPAIKHLKREVNRRLREGG